jgi:ABC-type sugar transport system ATPase subunit
MVAGLEETTEGRIAIGGRDVTHLDPAERGVAMVFQTYALYPHMTVAENMGFGLKMTGHPKAEIDGQGGEASRVLKLDDYLSPQTQGAVGRAAPAGRDRAGDRARTGRVPVRRAAVEPRCRVAGRNAGGDRAAAQRDRRHDDLRHPRPGRGDDAGRQDRRAARGPIEQVGKPLDLYNDPDNRFVAGFIGSPAMNFLKAQVAGSANGEAHVTVPDAPDHTLRIPLREAASVTPGQDVTIGIRPEHFLGTPGGPGLAVRIEVVENLGGIAFAYGTTNAGQDVIIKAESETPPQSGMAVTASIKDAYCHLFDVNGLALSAAAGAVRMQDAAA